MLPAKRMNMKIVFTGKPRFDSNGCLTISLPKEESKKIAQTDEFLITVEGPINEKRTSYNRVVISI